MTSPIILTATGFNTTTLPSDWSITSNLVQIIAPGGGGASGAVKQSNSLGGLGGAGAGAGAYASQTNLLNPASSVAYYSIGTAGTGGSSPTAGGDTWFNDLNLLINSNTFSSWTKGGTSTLVGTGITAPDGTTSGWSFTEVTATATYRDIQQIYTKPASSVALEFTCYVKLGVGGNPRRVTVYLGGAANGYYFPFDISGAQVATPAIQGSGVSNPASSIITDSIATGSGGNGWYRAVCSLTTDTTTAFYVQIYLDNGSGTAATAVTYTSDSVSNIQIWGTQLNYGTVVKSYTATTTLPAYSVFAPGGAPASTSTHGTGGLSANAQGSIKYSGGNGADGGANSGATGGFGGAGGGAAGPAGVGGVASTTTGGAANNATDAGPTAGATPTAGTEFDGTHGCSPGGAGNTQGNASTAGANYGGGGAGGAGAHGNSGTSSPALQAGKNGGAGIIWLTYSPPIILSSPLKQYLRR